MIERMDEKLKSSEVEYPRTSRLTKSLFATVIMLVLMLAVVSTLVGVAYFVSSTNCNKPRQPAKPDVSGTVRVNSESGSEMDELQYSTEENFAMFTDANGLFTAMDYNKGLEIFNDPNNKDVCYILPTEAGPATPAEYRDFFSKRITNGFVNTTTVQMSTKVLQGKIKDLSFIPRAVQERCNSSYWVVENREEEHSIMKRSCRRVRRRTWGCWPESVKVGNGRIVVKIVCGNITITITICL